MNVVVFGGTTEGRTIAERLADAGVICMVSVATHEGSRVLADEPSNLRIHEGRLDVLGMRALCASRDLVIDATHPYAVEVSREAREAAQQEGVPYLRVTRTPSDVGGCRIASSVEEAISMITRDGAVLATTGSKDLASYKALPKYQERVYVRVLDTPQAHEMLTACEIPEKHAIFAMGPFSFEENIRAIDWCGARTLITKDGGAAGGFAEKRDAARARDVDVIVVQRPKDDNGVDVNTAIARALDMMRTQREFADRRA